MVTGEQPLYDDVAFKIPFRGNVDELYDPLSRTDKLTFPSDKE